MSDKAQPTVEGRMEAHQDAASTLESGFFKAFGGVEETAPPAAQKVMARGQDGKFQSVQVQNEEVEEPAQAEAQETEPQGQEPAPQQSEEVEVEIEGEKYIVPKKISDRFIQHADYTRKTQDLAELRRATSAEREAFAQERAFEQSVMQERQQLALVEMQLQQFQNADWQRMDTEQLLRTRAQLDQLKEAKGVLEGSIKSKRGQFDQHIQKVTEEALQAGRKFVEQRIKGWGEEQQRALFEYGMQEGYLKEELSKITDPRIVVSLWKAQQWDNLQRANPGVMKKAASAAPVVRPGVTTKQPSRVTQLSQAIKTAKTPQARKAAAEDYFAARLGGGR